LEGQVIDEYGVLPMEAILGEGKSVPSLFVVEIANPDQTFLVKNKSKKKIPEIWHKCNYCNECCLLPFKCKCNLVFYCS